MPIKSIAQYWHYPLPQVSPDTQLKYHSKPMHTDITVWVYMSSVWEFEYTPLSHTHQCIELFTHYYYSNASLFYCKSYYLVLASVMVSLSDRVLSAEFGIILIYWCVTKWRILKPSPSCHVNSNRFIDALCQWCILVCKCSLVSPSGMVFGISISICIRYWCHNYLEIGCRVYHSQFTVHTDGVMWLWCKLELSYWAWFNYISITHIFSLQV